MQIVIALGIVAGKAASSLPGTGGVLNGVSAVSGSNAWAVGSYVNTTGGTGTLILHWNGNAR